MILKSNLSMMKKLTSLSLLNQFKSVSKKLITFNENISFSTLHGSSQQRQALPCFLDALKHSNKPAIKDTDGLHTYEELFFKAIKLSKEISKFAKKGEFISILCPHSSAYVVSMWAGWLSECVVVPLSLKHPPAMLDYFLDDSKSEVLVASYHHLADQLKRSNKHIEVLQVDEVVPAKSKISSKLDDLDVDDWLHKSQSDQWQNSSALLVYTSGTTGRPKGVLHSHKTIGKMVDGMKEEWGWKDDDVIIHSLPLHHIHGIINALLTPLMTGALCVLCDFKPALLWELLLGNAIDNDLPRRANLLMGVPTMYSMLVDELVKKKKLVSQGGGSSSNNYADFKGTEEEFLKFVKTTCSDNIRLFVSGSAPLQIKIMEKWQSLTGHLLLERYGMTELGMVLGNPLKGPRIPGAVGHPFPHVEVAIAKGGEETQLLVRGDKSGTTIYDESEKEGELYVRGDTVFKGYLNYPHLTAKEFTKDGWFKTGDTASYDSQARTYRILGRTSVDVIKSGGYKLSAIQIENVLLGHPLIKEVTVVGVDDPKWGQVVAALVVLVDRGDGKEVKLTLKGLREWCTDHMPDYQAPSILKVVESLKRNQMGKINKKEILRKYFS